MTSRSQIIINDQGITITTNGKTVFKAGQHIFEGGQRVVSPVIQLPVLGDINTYNLRYLMKDQDGNIFSNYRYVAFLPNGNSVEGHTDENGYTEFFETIQSEDVAIHLFKDEKLDID